MGVTNNVFQQTAILALVRQESSGATVLVEVFLHEQQVVPSRSAGLSVPHRVLLAKTVAEQQVSLRVFVLGE